MQMYGVRYVRHWYIAATLLRPPIKILPLRFFLFFFLLEKTNPNHSLFINNNPSHWEFICKIQITFSLGEVIPFFAAPKIDNCSQSFNNLFKQYITIKVYQKTKSELRISSKDFSSLANYQYYHQKYNQLHTLYGRPRFLHEAWDIRSQ